VTDHELRYYRYLLQEIKRLHTENQACSVLLDSWSNHGREGVRNPWRLDLQKMTSDPMFRSAVEANLEPHFTRIQRGLGDAAALKELLRLAAEPAAERAPDRPQQSPKSP
jgi:hypothetical protein